MFDKLRLILGINVAQGISFLVKSLGLGAASVLPGEIASRLYPGLLQFLSQQVPKGVILVAGTNGKTTTTLLLRSILEQQGVRIAHNQAGANLLNGLTTTLIKYSNWRGKFQADYALLEVDENVLPLVIEICRPRLILVLNLFRDQLDRYGEIDTISRRWQQAIATLDSTTPIILNGDDPTLVHLGQNLPQPVLYFGLNEPHLYLNNTPHEADSLYCPSCSAPLQYHGFYLSHLGDFNCNNCGFTRPQLAINSQEWPQILVGVYNQYNTVAAVGAAEELGIVKGDILEGINNFKAAFGRAEEIKFNNQKIRILLAKNPVGMNEMIRTVKELKGDLAPTTLMVLNDRTPDGTDVSWIWDVDTDRLTELGGNLVVSGDRVYDLALRIEYSQPSRDFSLVVESELNQAITTALKLTPEGQTLYILPTYSAMLEVRKILTGKEIL